MTARLEYALRLSAAKAEHAEARQWLRMTTGLYLYSERLREHEEEMHSAYARAKMHLAAAKRLKKRAGVVMELGDHHHA